MIHADPEKEHVRKLTWPSPQHDVERHAHGHSIAADHSVLTLERAVQLSKVEMLRTWAVPGLLLSAAWSPKVGHLLVTAEEGQLR